MSAFLQVLYQNTSAQKPEPLYFKDTLAKIKLIEQNKQQQH